MDLQLNGKVIVVTGGSKGIGAAIVRECAREGAIPVIVDKDVDTGKAVQAELRQAGGACEFVAAELSVAKACASAVETIVNTIGHLDALVNNAGVNDGVGLERGNPEEFVKSLER